MAYGDAAEFSRGADPRGATMAPRGRTAPTVQTGGSRVRGIVTVLAIFLITLAGAAVDSLFMGMGLGLITLACLVGSTVLGAIRATPGGGGGTPVLRDRTGQVSGRPTG